MMSIKTIGSKTFFCLLLAILVNPMFSQDKIINLALGKKVQASSEQAEYPASNIVDGKITRESKWMSATNKAPHILEIDFEKYCNISEIRFYSGILYEEKTATEKNQANGFWSVKNFKMQYWDDANWTDFPKASILENRLTKVDLKFENSISTYKIRMVADDGEKISVMEIEVLGTVATNMPAPPTLTSDLKKHVEITGDQTATLKVLNEVIGKSLKYVGYNQGYYMPGSNVSGWLEYSNVNSLRIWPSLSIYAPIKAVQVDKNLNSVVEFDKRKEELRRNPEENKFIKWEILKPLYVTPEFESNNTMVFEYAISECKRLGIKPILQINARDFNDTWSNKWQQWQRFYSLAYHAAKTADVAMFAMQNEPNHVHSGPMKLEQWISAMQIVSDAVHSAIEDVNKKYNKNLKANFVGPVTAGQNTDWWATIAKNVRTDYHGNTVDHDLLDIFSTHSYNSPASGYSTRVDNIRKILVDNHPNKKSIPIVFTEIGRWMNNYLIDKEETMDSPSLFTEWAGIYANNMKNNAYGMWAFKLVTNTSSTFPRGIKSGHHYTWQGSRFVEDAHQNLAKNAKVIDSDRKEINTVTDGDKSDASSWTSDGKSKEKWLEINLGKVQELGSAVVYNGSEGGVFTAPDRINNFKLQYWNGNKWELIPGTLQKDNKYAQVYMPFSKSIQTQKVRFSTDDEGVIKVREIKLFGKDAVPSKEPNYNISGIQRTGEVVRLFAKGFKDERDLYHLTRSTDDSGLDTYISFDSISDTYYMWLVQRGNFAYNLNFDLSDLNIPDGNPVYSERVDALTYGEAAVVSKTTSDKKLTVTLPAQSVTLVTIPKIQLSKQVQQLVGDTYVAGGANKLKNYGKEKVVKVRLDAENPSNNNVAYFNFKTPKNSSLKSRALLHFTGKVDKGDTPFRLHVYAIPTESFNEKTLNWENAPQLDSKEALIKNVGSKVKIAGELAFTKTDERHSLDVTDIIHKNTSENITFVVVRETRELGDDYDKGRTLLIQSKESSSKPTLEIWFDKK